MRRVAVIGAGAAGLMAANTAASYGAKVVVFEKNGKAGKKIYITGKGRCNFTNACDRKEFLEHVVDNSKFLYSALSAFSSFDTIDYFESLGMKTKVERGRRAFPVSDHASDVTKALTKDAGERGVEIRFECEVKEIYKNDGGGFEVTLSNGAKETFDSLIIATGGMSYPTTGSTGDGYRFAREFGHEIKALTPALTSLDIKEEGFKALSGLTLKNIGIKLSVDGSVKYEDFGEMLFTGEGVSGPVILSASFFVTTGECFLYIDLKPRVSTEELDERLLREFAAGKNQLLKNVFPKFLPGRLSDEILEYGGFAPGTKVNSVTREQRRKLIHLLKELKLTVTGKGDCRNAVITRGGVAVNELFPKTFASRIVRDLYFAGEVVDVAAFTGGYNLQIAWSSGYLAGMSAAKGEI